MDVKILALVVVFVACAISGTSAIKCYQCTTVTDGDSCGDPFSSGTQTDNCQQCGKAKYKAGGVSVVARICNPVSTGSNGCQSGSYQGVDADLCYCDSDLCNASSRMSVSMATTVFFGFALLIIKKLF